MHPPTPNSTMKRLLFVLFALGLTGSAWAQAFGGSLAIGDGQVLVGELRNQMTSSALYVFEKDASGNWVEAHQIKASDENGTDDRFGGALALDGTYLLVGAAAKNGSAGAAYMLMRDGDGWAEAARLVPSEMAAAGDGFGSSVALAGNWALISAPNQQEGMGAVYAFQRGTDGTWTQQARLTGSDATAGDGFGTTVALEGGMALIGAPQQNNRAGAVYAFHFADGAWSEMGKLDARGIDNGNRFGSSLALHDGHALVGAPRQNSSVGAVLHFSYADGEWSQVATLMPFDGARGRFGEAVAFDGNTAWIGAAWTGRRHGSIYQFSRDAQGWSGVQRLAGPDVASGDRFGGAIALGDGMAVVGLVGDDYGAGTVVMYERDGDGWTVSNRVSNVQQNFDMVTGGRVACEDGEASAFGCEGINLLSFMPVSSIGGGRGVQVNDLWGWEDPQTGREYALVGRRDGTSFVDVTDAENPRYLGDLPMTEGANGSVWRDIKVYKDHAFIVADGAGPHGMQVFDLTELRNVTGDPVTFTTVAHYDQIFSAHNIVINEDTGFAYSVGSSGGGETCGGGLHMIDIREPTNPTFVGCFADPSTGRSGTGYSHDAQCVMYRGPDEDYQNREICFGSNETALSIADVTDKENPIAIAQSPYPNVAYSHQGWLTDDQRYFYMNDEGDEVTGLVEGTRTLIWDVADLDDPQLVGEYIADNQSIDHNLYIKGNLMYQSNYVAGLRILDISNPTNPVEVAHFDTVPYGPDSPATGGGSWSNYPYFKSGIIVVTSGREGLFILKKKDVDI